MLNFHLVSSQYYAQLLPIKVGFLVWAAFLCACNSGGRLQSHEVDPSEFLNDVRLTGDSARQVIGVEKQGDTFVVKTYLSDKDQFAVELCKGAAVYVFERNKVDANNILIQAVSGKQLIRIGRSNRDCGQPSSLSPVYNEQEYRASLPPPEVKIGMDYETVKNICGQGHDLSTYESAYGVTASVTYSYDRKTATQGCYGRMTFRDRKLESIYRN